MNHLYTVLGTCAWFCWFYQELTFYDASCLHLLENCYSCFCFSQGCGP